MRLKFSLLWACVQTCGCLIWLSGSVILFPDPNAVLVFFGGAFFGVTFGYFGVRGLSRKEQIIVTDKGLGGSLVRAHGEGEIIVWDRIVRMKYRNRGLHNIFRIWARLDLHLLEGRTVYLRDFVLLSPHDLGDVAEVVKRKLETGELCLPSPRRWWQSATVIFVSLMLGFWAAFITLDALRK